jgi:hypothetical protein
MSYLMNKSNALGRSCKENVEPLLLRMSMLPEGSRILNVKTKNSKIELRKVRQIMRELVGRLSMLIQKQRNCRKPSTTWQGRVI